MCISTSVYQYQRVPVPVYPTFDVDVEHRWRGPKAIEQEAYTVCVVLFERGHHQLSTLTAIMARCVHKQEG